MSQIAEFWSLIDRHEWNGEHGQVLHFHLAALVAQIEAINSDRAVAVVTYDQLGLQAGRDDGAVYRQVRELVERRYVRRLDLGNDGGALHGDPTRPYEGARWAIPSPSSTPFAAMAHDRESALHEAAVHEAERDRSLLMSEFDSDDLTPDEREEWLAECMASDGWTDWSVPAIEIAESVSLSRPPLRDLSSVLIEVDHGVVVPVPARAVPTEGVASARRAESSCALDYLTWSDCWREREAGILGWALARHDITVGVLERAAERLGTSVGMTARRASDILGVHRSTANRVLGRLLTRGYAKPNDDSTYRLLFREQFLDGHLHRRSHLDTLIATQKRPAFWPTTVDDGEPIPGGGGNTFRGIK